VDRGVNFDRIYKIYRIRTITSILLIQQILSKRPLPHEDCANHKKNLIEVQQFPEKGAKVIHPLAKG
jgi:hypothetical protein